MPQLTVKDAIDVLSDEKTVIYWREGQQPNFQKRLISLIRRLSKPKQAKARG